MAFEDTHSATFGCANMDRCRKEHAGEYRRLILIPSPPVTHLHLKRRTIRGEEVWSHHLLHSRRKLVEAAFRADASSL